MFISMYPNFSYDFNGGGGGGFKYVIVFFLIDDTVYRELCIILYSAV